MKNKQQTAKAKADAIVFLPAITPLEAAVLPAQERARYGTLGMIPHAYEAGRSSEAQRAKIWVR